MDASGTPVRPWSCGRSPGHRPRNANWPLRWVAGRCRLEKGTQRVLDSRYVPGDALPGTSNRFVKREPSFNADYRGGVTCHYDTQLLGACLHASESGGRSRPEAVRGMPDVPIASPATGPPEGRAAVGLVNPAFFIRGLRARLLRVLGS